MTARSTPLDHLGIPFGLTGLAGSCSALPADRIVERALSRPPLPLPTLVAEPARKTPWPL